jgi:hypothetical protein
LLTLFLFAASIVLKVEKVDPLSKTFQVTNVLPAHFVMEEVSGAVPQVGEFLRCNLIKEDVHDALGNRVIENGAVKYRTLFECKTMKFHMDHVILDPTK